MVTTTYAFETRIGAAARSGRSRTQQYGEDAPQLVSRFWSKSLKQRLALPVFERGGA